MMSKQWPTLTRRELGALKLQIRAQLKKCRPRIEICSFSRTPRQRKHFRVDCFIGRQLQTQDGNCSAKSIHKHNQKKHFGQIEYRPSPNNTHHERKHYNYHNHHQMDLKEHQPRKKRTQVRSISATIKNRSNEQFNKVSFKNRP